MSPSEVAFYEITDDESSLKKSQQTLKQNNLSRIVLDPTDDRNQYPPMGGQYPPMGAPYPPAAPGYGGMRFQVQFCCCDTVSRFYISN